MGSLIIGLLVIFLIVVGIYSYFTLTSLLAIKVEIIGDTIHLRSPQNEVKIPINSITKLRLKTAFDPLVLGFTLHLEALTDGIWRIIFMIPIFHFIFFPFLKYPINLNIIKEIIRQNPHVELSDDLKTYLITGKFEHTSLFYPFMDKWFVYEVISALIMGIIFILILIF